MSKSDLTCLFLSERDLESVGGLDMPACVKVMEDAFKLVGTGDYLMGGPSQNEHGQKLFFPLETDFPNMPIAGPDRRFMSLIAYLGGDFNVTGMKWYGSNIENAKRGLPRSILMTVLNDPDTGKPLAIMAANTISAMRTGAVPGLASKYLAKQDSKVIGLIGAGIISKTSLMGLAAANKQIKEVNVYDIIHDKAESFAKEMSEKLGITVRAVDRFESAIIGADIVNVASSGANKPFIKAEWLKKGAMLSLPGAVHLEDGIMQNAKLVVDEWKMHVAYYEQNQSVPKDDPRRFSTSFLFDLIEEGKLKESEIESLGTIVSGISGGRQSEEENIIFLTGGMPIQDVAWSHYLYEKAKQASVGQTLDFWDHSPVLS